MVPHGGHEKSISDRYALQKFANGCDVQIGCGNRLRSLDNAFKQRDSPLDGPGRF